MKKLLRLSAPLLVIITGFLVVQGLVAAKPEPEKNDEEIRKISLYVDSVQSEQVVVAVKTQGEVRPKTEIDLIPQVSGRIVALSDSRASPIIRLANHGFVVSVDTPQFFPSSASTIALLETLLSFVISVASGEIPERVARFHARRHELGMYYSEDK